MASVSIIDGRVRSEFGMVDTATGAVRPLSGEVGAPVDIEPLGQVPNMRAGRFEILGNVDVLIAASSRGPLASLEFSACHLGRSERTSLEFSANA